MRIVLGLLSLAIFLSVTLSVSPSLARPLTPAEQRWADFKRDPKTFMNQLPPKTRLGAPPTHPKFSRTDISSKNFVLKKRAQGYQGTPKRLGGFAEWAPEAQKDGQTIESFLDLERIKARGAKVLTTLAEMDQVRAADVQEAPWSDNYWPLAQGIIGARYADTELWRTGMDWKTNFDYVQLKSLKTVYTSKDAEQIDMLSPSEKYDLLIGDLTDQGTEYPNGFLTPTLWKQGQWYFENKGHVEGWMGICHGWAPASYMVPRPKKFVVAKAADQSTELKFYPSDMKGLASFLWSNSHVHMIHMGHRCNSKDPAKDLETGRITDQNCWDTNPANWHLAIVNRIASQQQSFVMDATFDYEVWNQPVVGYSYVYLNPVTGQQAESLQEATVNAADYLNDPLKKYRSPLAKTIVGIEMTVTYGSETEPTHNDSDSRDFDANTAVTYMYDLELDESGRIIGGEWYQNAHPDFLWTPIPNGHAHARGDGEIPAGAWLPGQELPAMWKEIARKTAITSGQPLAAIVDALIYSSQTEDQKR